MSTLCWPGVGREILVGWTMGLVVGSELVSKAIKLLSKLDLVIMELIESGDVWLKLDADLSFHLDFYLTEEILGLVSYELFHHFNG